jgi:MFS transporter, DHA2 family, multidrug resistance protein
VRRQALTMGFADAFMVVGVLLTIAAASLFFAQKPKTGAAGGAH